MYPITYRNVAATRIQENLWLLSGDRDAHTEDATRDPADAVRAAARVPGVEQR